jgi:hypothetical protein
MPYSVLVFETRKPGMSIDAYINHYDNIHIPLVKECTGDAFPQSHTRYYLKRQPLPEGASTDTIPTPLIFYGKPEDVDYDCVVIMTFEDVAAFARFQQAYEQSPRKAEMDADEELFILKSEMKAIAIEDAHVTLR